jgi:hypothetical protein
MTVSLLVPTRGRPDQIASMWASACATASRPNDLELVIYVDDDDPTVLPDLGDATIIHGPRIVLSDCWNKCAAAATGDILWLGNDDVLFRTPGWDPVDQTHQERMARGAGDNVAQLYLDRLGDREEDIRRLRAVME